MSADTLGQVVLELLKVAGIPAAIIGGLAAAMALWQTISSAAQAAGTAEDAVTTLLTGSSRVVRAFASFVVSHVLAAGLTLTITSVILINLPSLRPVAGTHPSASWDITVKVAIAVAIYFLVTDWVHFEYGDTVPGFLGIASALAGVLAIAGFGAVAAADTDDWGLLVPWLVAAVLWWKTWMWSAAAGSDLARALQTA